MGISSFSAWGLLTANPYAIRALEKATRRRCDPKKIKANLKELMDFGRVNLPYVSDETEVDISEFNSKINTEFFIDHSDIQEKLEKATSSDKPWLLGTIVEGWEWFAFTFSDQKQMELLPSEINSMLRASDEITRKAYARMPMSNESHKWASKAKVEVDYIINNCKLIGDKSILDIGCGMGRHSMELARRGFNVTGIDYISKFIEIAQNKASEEALNVNFVTADILISDLFSSNSFDCILCLYDVIGSYADNSKNEIIISKIANLLKPGGRAVLSVMNLT